MALKFERFVSPGKGNGLWATGSIRRGELVYSAEPLACCVSNRLARNVCHHCFSRHETLLRCSQCKMARYCDITCQKQAWTVHKSECKCLQSVLPRIPTDSVRLAARILFALLRPTKDSSRELYTIEEHESHLSSMSEQKKEGLSHLASMLQLYLQQELPVLEEGSSAIPPSCRDPLSLMAKVTCNCFTISDGELQEIGVGLYPSLSLLNHDCGPNCVMVFEGTKLQLRAVRDIKPGDELTISYVDPLALTEERRKQLQEQYHFTCHCQRCDSADTDALMMSGEEATWHLLKDDQPRQNELKADSSRTVPDENLYKLKVTDAALDACIQLGLWEEALGFGLKTLPVYRLYFSDPHPVFAVELIRVGKLQHYLEHITAAMDTFKQAYEIVKVTHGDTHPLASDLRMKMEECRCEMDQGSKDFQGPHYT